MPKSTVNHKLSKEGVQKIIKAIEAGTAHCDLAREYNVTQSTIYYHWKKYQKEHNGENKSVSPSPAPSSWVSRPIYPSEQPLQPLTDKQKIITAAPVTTENKPAITGGEVRDVQYSKRQYRTDNLLLAAYLCYHYHTLLRTEGSSNSKLIMFLFNETKELQDLVLKFSNREASVEPIKFSQAIRLLRSRMYENTDRPIW